MVLRRGFVRCGSSTLLPSFFFFQAEDGIRDLTVTGVQTCALPISTQHRSISARIAQIDGMLAGAEKHSHDGWKKASMGIGPVLVLLLSKGKFLLLGLTKIGTLLTMFASLGVYWALYGWALALGVVISIYIHEMGHVGMIRRYGF